MQVSVGQERGNMIIVKQSIRMRRMMPKRAAASRNPREFFVLRKKGLAIASGLAPLLFVSGLVSKDMHKIDGFHKS